MKQLLICYLLFPLSLIGQQALKLEDIMDGNNFIGHQPHSVLWGPWGEFIYFKWKSQNDDHENNYRYDLKSAEITKIKPEEIFRAPIEGYHTNRGKTAFYYQNGDRIYFCSKKGPRLIYQSAGLQRIQRVITQEKVIIKQDQSYYLFDHVNGLLKQCIAFDNSSSEDEQAPNYLERQQLELFQYIKDQNNEAKRKTHLDSIEGLTAVPTYKTSGRRVGVFAIDNSASFALFRLDEYPKRKSTKIEASVTKSGYSESINARPKVGHADPKHELCWMDLNTMLTGQIDIKILPGIQKDPDYLKIYDDALSLVRTKPKAVIYTQVVMSPAGDQSLIEIKSYDNKDRWLVVFDHSSKKTECINHQHNEAWIGGPGISGWNMVPGNIGWISDKTTYFHSEKSGYSHLYTYDMRTKVTEALTKGKFEIYRAELSKKGDRFYITSNKSQPGNRGFYHLDIATKKWTPILAEDGNYEAVMSPNETHVAIRYSYKNKPWDLYWAANSQKTETKEITKSTRSDFDIYQWREPEIITFKNQKGVEVYARLFKPEPSKKNGAAIQFVHGAGYLQNAHNWWSGYYREYMFHNLLCDKGYTIIDIDYSASKGYGRDFRTSIYRHMGGQDLDDQIAGRQYLIDREKIDPKKVGIYGGSYGGFITIMALLKYPSYFQCGAAIRSVTDWAHYNHAYTSNILNTPETDSIAFRRSSPIYFAENLKDQLLILHGMVDDNVQFQDVVRLNQRFIELGKSCFDMALYPIEPHGFKKTTSWIDEYGRILKLFDENLN